MEEKIVHMDVPAEPKFARSVRMMAATLAVSLGADVETVDDVRMAAEEGFVYACASGVDVCHMDFILRDADFAMRFDLGESREYEQTEQCQYAKLLVTAICDVVEIVPVSERGMEQLHLSVLR